MPLQNGFLPKNMMSLCQRSKQNHFKGYDGLYGGNGRPLVNSLYFFFQQRRLLLLTGIMTFGFVAARTGGLFIDGFDQHFTYIELAFESFALLIIITVYLATRHHT